MGNYRNRHCIAPAGMFHHQADPRDIVETRNDLAYKIVNPESALITQPSLEIGYKPGLILSGYHF